jgi:hypothetical protein
MMSGILKVLSLAMVMGAFQIAQAEDTNPLSKQAWSSLNKIAPELKKKRVRKACQLLGEFNILQREARAAYEAEDKISNPWDHRNLGFAKDGVKQVSTFCNETPDTETVSIEEARKAADSASNAIGLE